MREDLAEDQNQPNDAPTEEDRAPHRPSKVPKRSPNATDLERRFAEHREKIEARPSHKKARVVRATGQRDDLWLLTSAREIFGDALTLVVLTGRGERTTSLVLEVALRALANQENANSLRTAVEIANELLRVEAKSTVQAWFVGQNPTLDDHAPALVVRSNPDAVRDAAKHFVAYG